jgi:eukaryotic-like serine/threonine-protein kinase
VGPGDDTWPVVNTHPTSTGRRADEPSREETLFHAARLLSRPEDRVAFLEFACSDEPELRQCVEDLLAARAQADAFFDANPAKPAINFAAHTAAPAIVDYAPVATPAVIEPELPGRIGRYKLLQKIGEGGCGVVYMAEQEEPVRRKVALKIVKPGMDTRQVVARFEAERQALALMEHPNIAKVLDGGVVGEKPELARKKELGEATRQSADSLLPASFSLPTSGHGRPYFVMELVRGVKITEYCDQARLSTRERLELFMKVCQAIQHAHQKGIIHRDIKPPNVLVTLHDGVPVPKVIDFGIGRATSGHATRVTSS